MNFKSFLNEAQETVTIDSEKYSMKVILSQKGDRHHAPVWHLAFLNKNKTIVLPNELTYHAGYDQGHNSKQQWYLQTKQFGSVGNGHGIDRPTAPVLSYDFENWYIEALNGKGTDADSVQNAAEFIDSKMSIKDIKQQYS